MVSINKSFLYGIGFASITWIISLTLYIRLTKNEDNDTALTLTKYSKRSYSFNDLDNTINKESVKRKYSQYVNSQQLLKKLSQKAVQPNTLNKELDELGLVKTAADQRKKEEGYRRHAYNVLISDNLDYHRRIPDTRNALYDLKIQVFGYYIQQVALNFCLTFKAIKLPGNM